MLLLFISTLRLRRENAELAIKKTRLLRVQKEGDEERQQARLSWRVIPWQEN